MSSLVDDWITTTLGDFASLQRGHDLPEPARNPGDVPVMGSFGITGSHSVSSARGPGVTVGRSGASIGVVSYIDCDYWPLNTCLYVTDFHGNNPRFVYYFLKTLDLASFNSGSAQPSLNRNYIHPVEIDVPQRTEQDAIATLLRALDDKIELNRQTNETLEALARALFKDWFVDFGPTRTKAEGGAPYLAPELWALFPDALDDEDKPVGWVDRPLKSFGEIVTGKTPSTKRPEYFGGAVPFLKIPDMHGKMYVLETLSSLSLEGAQSQSKKTLPSGSISVSCIATPGLVVLNHRETQTNQQINSLVPTAPEQSFFLYWSCLQLAIEVMLGGSGGSVFHNMNKTSFGNLNIHYPTDELAKFFSSAVSPFHDGILANEHESQTLAQTRDLLLPKLMSGELRLRDAEREVEAVL
ncbi:restriction endonuclease subunit S [Lamprobacter modestohalophilus]|uniref:restriction endonuclease subunit S n=1 Tax=Lamprobacter modestohalophilus TaxID=1064514 RepID=UPI002ADEAD37|nr:restriction endonuclease subunit S [Lamprobacter modestohalophilus]MEA1048837.1 restriction endonuclease subunit S [Lamprobacter modestohalophilus]